jgi:hypothetical protein
MPRKTRSWTIELTVVGLQFRWRVEGRITLQRNCPIPVRLEREPDNPKDENAIKVLIDADYKLKALKGKHLGYLRRDTAALLAPRLDAGTLEPVKLWVTEVDPPTGEATLEARFVDVPKKPVVKPKKRTRARA